MRVFVVTTGRSGSLTFAQACAHATNYTSGHETNIDRVQGRFDYRDQHIEVDNRLAWMLPQLDAANPGAFFVHLTRDHEATARSYANRSMDLVRGRRRLFESVKRHRGRTRVPLVDAFAHGIIRQRGILPSERVEASARLMVETINANIIHFLQTRPHLVIDIADAAVGIEELWRSIGAEGDLDAARAEFSTRHNAGQRRR